MMSDSEEFDDIIAESLRLTEKIMEKPDIPNTQVLPLMNRLEAYAARLRILSITMEKNKAVQAKEVARGLHDLVGVLKYQLKQHWNENA